MEVQYHLKDLKNGKQFPSLLFGLTFLWKTNKPVYHFVIGNNDHVDTKKKEVTLGRNNK